MEVIKVLAKILTNILTALYEPFGFSLLLSFLAMFFYLYGTGDIHRRLGQDKNGDAEISYLV